MTQTITIKKRNKTITLVGTSHVDLDSVSLVKNTITTLNPDIVCVELDDERYSTITNPNSWENKNIIDIIKQKKAPLMLINLALANFQKKLADNLDSKPGNDMLTAIETANSINAEIKLVDRNIQITFKRIWAILSFWEKCNLPLSIFFSDDKEDVDETDIKELLETDSLELMLSDFDKHHNAIKSIILDERDTYITNNINSYSENNIVVILGKAHLPGVTKLLNSKTNTTNDMLNTLPKKKITTKLATIIIPLIIVIGIGYSFYSGFDNGIKQLSYWLIWNSSLAALFTLFSKGHPLTILTAFITAPIGTINPILSVGMFAAITEATIRKPQVKDLENAQTDIHSMKTFFNNKFLKAMLIFITASLGGAIGNIITSIDIIKKIF